MFNNYRIFFSTKIMAYEMSNINTTFLVHFSHFPLARVTALKNVKKFFMTQITEGYKLESLVVL
jgi:hypothetical protein